MVWISNHFLPYHIPDLALLQVIVHDYLFDASTPRSRFAHVSLIVASDRRKLSKRHGATSVGEFKEMGYLPEAMADYLSQLGWNDGTDQQYHTLDELKQTFSVERQDPLPTYISPSFRTYPSAQDSGFLSFITDVQA